MSDKSAKKPNVREFNFAVASAGSVIVGAILFGLGIIFPHPAFLIGAVAAPVLMFVIWMIAIVHGSAKKQDWRQRLFFVCVGLSSISPVVATAFLFERTLSSTFGTVPYTAAVGAVTLLMVAFYTAALESDVAGWRRDALRFSFAITTIAGAAITGVSALQAAF